VVAGAPGGEHTPNSRRNKTALVIRLLPTAFPTHSIIFKLAMRSIARSAKRSQAFPAYMSAAVTSSTRDF